jgi:hypothetical protein
MDNGAKFYIATLVAVVGCVALIVIGGINTRDDTTIGEMVQRGADPYAAGCAVGRLPQAVCLAHACAQAKARCTLN